MDAALDSAAGGQPNFATARRELMAAASAEGAPEARAALENLYRGYFYLVYAFILGRGCDGAIELCYQPTAPEALTAERVFEARWTRALIGIAPQRLRADFFAKAKDQLFDALQGFLFSGEETQYQQTATALGVSLCSLKIAIHWMRGRYHASCVRTWPARLLRPRKSRKNRAACRRLCWANLANFGWDPLLEPSCLTP